MDETFDILEFFLNNEDGDPAMEFDLLAGGDPTTNARENPEAAQPQGGQPNTQAPEQPQAAAPQAAGADTGADAGGDMDMGGDAGGDDMGGDMGEGGDDEFGDEEGGEDDGAMQDMDTNSNMTEDPDMERRINLRKLITALITAYSSSIDAMTNSIPPSEEGLATKYYNLQEKMMSAKKILYEIATNDIYIKPYEDSLRRYSALNQLYSICIEYLNTILIKKKQPMKRKRRQPIAFQNKVKMNR